MKVSYAQCASVIKTKSEPSSIVKDLWISRSAIATLVGDRIQPVFGFSAGYDRKKCEDGSFYEVFEHLAFLPYLYDKTRLNDVVTFISNEPYQAINDEKNTIKDFLIGSPGSKGAFYGNGCAVSTDIKTAISHSKRELLERHICCEAWYKQARPLIKESDFKIEILNPTISITIYKTETIGEGTFSLAALESDETGFFAIGAAIRDNFDQASQHAVGEVVMLFEDAKKLRSGLSTTVSSRQKILSLRDIEISKLRKLHFQNIIKKAPHVKDHILPLCSTIAFEPFPDLYAARTFSENCSDPRLFEYQSIYPIMPLF